MRSVCSSLKIAPVTATPIVAPSPLSVTSRPEAAPAWSRETAFIAARFIGVSASPMPKPMIAVGSQSSA